MYYDKTPIAVRYREMIDQLKKEFPGWEFPEDFGSLISLHAFHKEPKHSDEKEIRLMYLPHLFDGDIEQHFDFKVGDYHTGFTEYIELPLHSDQSEIYVVRKNVSRHNHKIELDDKEYPKIKLLSIQFGDNEERFTQIKLNDLRRELADYLTGKFGYRIEVHHELFSTGLRQKDKHGCLPL